MIRNLKSLGLALAAVLALGAVAASAASASPALFTANVGASEVAKIDATQSGTNLFKIPGLPNLTCTGANGTGRAVTVTDTGNTVYDVAAKEGPESTYVELNPSYSGCHVVIAGQTRTVTVTMNTCSFLLNATKNTEEFESPHSITEWAADLTIICSGSNEIQIHVYSTTNTEVGTTCTYDIPAQHIPDQIQLTNEAGTPNDVLAHIHATVTTTNTTSGTSVCGTTEHVTSVYEGTQTIQATNASGTAVNASVS